MRIRQIDHFVLTTRSLVDCLHFYVGVLGMRHEEHGGHHALLFGTQKINVHTAKGEFQPAAQCPEYGSQDFCLVTDDALQTVEEEIRRAGWPVELGPVTRHGAMGEMESLYLRDPDGNLVELAHYRE